MLRLLPKSRGNRGNRGEEPQDEYHSDDLDGQTTLSWADCLSHIRATSVMILANKRGTMAPFLQTHIKSRARLISPWPSLVFTAKSSKIAWYFVDLSDAKNALVQKLTSVSFATELHVHRVPKSEILTLAHSCPLTNYSTNYILYCIDQRWLESLLMWAFQHLNIILSWPKSYNERSHSWFCSIEKQGLPSRWSKMPMPLILSTGDASLG